MAIPGGAPGASYSGERVDLRNVSGQKQVEQSIRLASLSASRKKVGVDDKDSIEDRRRTNREQRLQAAREDVVRENQKSELQAQLQRRAAAASAYPATSPRAAALARKGAAAPRSTRGDCGTVSPNAATRQPQDSINFGDLSRPFAGTHTQARNLSRQASASSVGPVASFSSSKRRGEESCCAHSFESTNSAPLVATLYESTVNSVGSGIERERGPSNSWLLSSIRRELSAEANLTPMSRKTPFTSGAAHSSALGRPLINSRADGCSATATPSRPPPVVNCSPARPLLAASPKRQPMSACPARSFQQESSAPRELQEQLAPRGLAGELAATCMSVSGSAAAENASVRKTELPVLHKCSTFEQASAGVANRAASAPQVLHDITNTTSRMCPSGVIASPPSKESELHRALAKRKEALDAAASGVAAAEEKRSSAMDLAEQLRMSQMETDRLREELASSKQQVSKLSEDLHRREAEKNELATKLGAEVQGSVALRTQQDEARRKAMALVEEAQQKAEQLTSKLQAEARRKEKVFAEEAQQLQQEVAQQKQKIAELESALMHTRMPEHPRRAPIVGSDPRSSPSKMQATALARAIAAVPSPCRNRGLTWAVVSSARNRAPPDSLRDSDSDREFGTMLMDAEDSGEDSEELEHSARARRDRQRTDLDMWEQLGGRNRLQSGWRGVERPADSN